MLIPTVSFFFFFNDTATTEIYTLSLHDALPICGEFPLGVVDAEVRQRAGAEIGRLVRGRSEEHTSELQSRSDLVCRLLLEKKKKKTTNTTSRIPTPYAESHVHDASRGRARYLHH